METFFILFFLLNLLIEATANEGHVPALMWTSVEFQGRKNVDYLAGKKIKSELFESFIMETLTGRKPLVLIFLEQSLGEDFEWKNKNGDILLPFLANLSRVDHFRSIQSPYQTLLQLTKKGFKRKKLKPEMDFVANEGDIWTLEFGDLSSSPDAIRNRDETIKEMLRRLANYGKPWVAIYTARDGVSKVRPWFVERDHQDGPSKAVSLYMDDFTGFSLLTAGSIQLYLPSAGNLAVRNLNSCLGASAKPSANKMDFVIWFLNYTLTFHLNKQNGEWTINGVRLLNGNGDSLNLTPRWDVLPENNCRVRLNEFQSDEDPAVKVKLPKYKFLKLPIESGSCLEPYRFPRTFFLILSCLVLTAACWNRLLQNSKFVKKSKKVFTVSISELISLNPNTGAYAF